jgi:chromosome segregation ATPase
LTVTAAQRTLIRAEAATILRRLAAAETEAAREREETAALAAERARYAQAVEALAEEGVATAEDLQDLEGAILAADRVLAAQRAADARTADWLGAVRAAVAGLADAPEEEATAPSPSVLRSLSRVGAMLGTMLGEVEAQRDRTRAALNAAQARPFAGVERNPAVASALARAAGNGERDPGRRQGDG